MELTFQKDDLLYALQVLQGVAGGAGMLYLSSLTFLSERRIARLSVWRQIWKSASK